MHTYINMILQYYNTCNTYILYLYIVILSIIFIIVDSFLRIKNINDVLVYLKKRYNIIDGIYHIIQLVNSFISIKDIYYLLISQ